MRFIKLILIALALFAMLLTGISMLMPSKSVTVRTVMVKAPADSIFKEVSDLNSWTGWQPFFRGNKNQVKINPSGKQAFWNQDHHGYDLRHLKDSAFTVTMVLDSKGRQLMYYRISVGPVQNEDGVQVEWMAETSLAWYPWEKFSGMLSDAVTGPVYEQALQELKKYCERKYLPIRGN